MFIWSALVLALAFTLNIQRVMAIRWLLGIFESCFAPCLLTSKSTACTPKARGHVSTDTCDSDNAMVYVCRTDRHHHALSIDFRSRGYHVVYPRVWLLPSQDQAVGSGRLAVDDC
jgi:hypothetical protein